MNAQEQITGVLNVLDHARSVTVSGKPVVIKRDSFEVYPDYEAVLEKLADEYSAIKIIQYPTMDEVDHRASVGFYSDAYLNERISYQIEVLPQFDELIAQRKSLSDTVPLTGTVLFSDNVVELHLSDNTQIVLSKELRTDMPPYNFMSLVNNRPKEYLTKAEVFKHLNIDKNIDEVNLTEIIRQCGFNAYLKQKFFPKTTGKKVFFQHKAEIEKHRI